MSSATPTPTHSDATITQSAGTEAPALLYQRPRRASQAGASVASSPLPIAPLIHIVIPIVGAPFHAFVTPEDGVIRAAGFATESDPGAMTIVERMAKLDPKLAARGVDAKVCTAGAVADALSAYSEGDVRAIDTLAVAQPESPFRGEVWRALRKVAPGHPVTYSELAALAGRPAAVRAAASGCANNLVALVVPCHRIVRLDGGLGGYLFGTDIKRRLLEHEAIHGSLS